MNQGFRMVPVIRTRVSLPDKSVICCILEHDTVRLGNGMKRSMHRYNIYCTYNEGVIEGRKDVSNTKDILSFADSGSKGDVLLLGLPGLPPRLQSYTTI